MEEGVEVDELSYYSKEKNNQEQFGRTGET